MKDISSKVERILRFIIFLDGPYPRTRQECLEYITISESTFYEYVNLLKNLGFEVKQDKGNYWIDISESENDLLTRLYHFNEEEAYLLSKAIRQLDVTLPVAAKLHRKLIRMFDYDQALAALIRKEKSEIINKINDAISARKQLLLINYSSGNSQTIKNRLIEPFEFMHDFELLWAYDINERACRQFKISRIEDVELTPLDWKRQKDHHTLPVDVFRNTGILEYSISIELTLRAYNLLIEEYPLAEKFCTLLANKHYHFETKIAKYEGAARFVLGLFEDVQVLGSAEFLQYLSKKVKRLEINYLIPGISESD